MDVFMIWNIAEGDERILIYKICVVFLVALVAYALIWVKVVKKQKLFQHIDLETVNGLTEESAPVLGEPAPTPETVPAQASNLVHSVSSKL